MKLKHEKVIGGWRFQLGGKTFLAIRNGAGFAGRDWELWQGTVPEPEYGMKSGQWECLEDQLATRKECVEIALSRGKDRRWASTSEGSNMSDWDPNGPCETCSHAGGYDHGMQFTMRGVCSDCVDCYPEEEGT